MENSEPKVSEEIKSTDQVIEPEMPEKIAINNYTPSNANETYVIRDRDELNKLFDNCKIVGGQKSSDQMKAVVETQKQHDALLDEIHLNKFRIPPYIFKDFPEVTYDNEKNFEYLVHTLMVNFFEKFNDRGMEFPENVCSRGRAIIHAVSNFLGVHSISHGKSNRNNRKVIVYARHLFPSITEKEQYRIKKEKEKIQEKFDKDGKFMVGVQCDNAVTMREKMLKEIYNKQRGLAGGDLEEFWEGPIEVRIEEIKKKMKIHEGNMKKVAEKEEKRKLSETSMKSTTSKGKSTQLKPDSEDLAEKENSNEASNLDLGQDQTDLTVGQKLLKKRFFQDSENQISVTLTEEQKAELALKE